MDCFRFTSGVTPAVLLTANMAADPFVHIHVYMYTLKASIGGIQTGIELFHSVHSKHLSRADSY